MNRFACRDTGKSARVVSIQNKCKGVVDWKLSPATLIKNSMQMRIAAICFTNKNGLIKNGESPVYLLPLYLCDSDYEMN